MGIFIRPSDPGKGIVYFSVPLIFQRCSWDDWKKKTFLVSCDRFTSREKNICRTVTKCIFLQFVSELAIGKISPARFVFKIGFSIPLWSLPDNNIPIFGLSVCICDRLESGRLFLLNL